MRLQYYRDVPNFGDQLNLAIVPRWLGNVVDDDPGALLLAIGTIIYERAPAKSVEVVLGAGCGYAPTVELLRRDIYAVRGPLTAEFLGIDPSFAGIDPAYLAAELLPSPAANAGGGRPVFMPHWETDRDAGELWRRAAETAGLAYVSPLEDVGAIVARLAAAPVVVTEALHGAIVAESYGVPWVPLVLQRQVLAYKWRDWCASIGVPHRPFTALPRLALEQPDGAALWTAALGRIGLAARMERFRPLRRSGERDLAAAARQLAALATAAGPWTHRADKATAAASRDRLLAAADRLRAAIAHGRYRLKDAGRFDMGEEGIARVVRPARRAAG